VSEYIKLTPKRKHNPRRLDRILGVAAIVTIIIAWVVGYLQSNAVVEPFLYQALPEAERIEMVSGDTYAAYASNSPEALLGYISIGEANGYGGPMKVAVATDLEGNVIGMSVVEQRETPNWYNRVVDSDFIDRLFGKSFADPFQLDADVDGITGATYTSRAIAEAVRRGSREIATSQLELPVPPEPSPGIQFGIPELVLIGLFALGYVGHQRGFKYTRQARWVSMTVGLVVLGFIYTAPLTITYINKFLLGYWPEWQTHLYWYLLIGGVLFVFTIDNKNPYCEWFCPFGAAQECMGLVGGAKARNPQKYRSLFRWSQRGLAWLAIVLALLFRNPGLTSYEVFGTLFDLNGSMIQFALLGLVLLAALFIKRPWCGFLCPLHPVDEFIKMIRSWIKEIWRNLRPKTKTGQQPTTTKKEKAAVSAKS
jgi:NosR/NirI family nitrous oxide reductase transcriptional regulator